MFIYIEQNNLKMNRGDSYTLPLFINEGTMLCPRQYQLRQFDKIYIGIMEVGQSFENAIIRKVLTILSPTDKKGHPLFILMPEDTENLLTGKYFIEIKLVQINNEQNIVTTLLPLKEFFINGTNKQVYDTENVYNTEKSINKSDNYSSWEPLQSVITPDVPVQTQNEWIKI